MSIRPKKVQRGLRNVRGHRNWRRWFADAIGDLIAKTIAEGGKVALLAFAMTIWPASAPPREQARQMEWHLGVPQDLGALPLEPKACRDGRVR